MQNAILGLHGSSYCPRFALGVVSEGHLINLCCCAPQRPVSVGTGDSLVCLGPHPHFPSGWGGVLLSGNSAKVAICSFSGSCLHSDVSVRLRKGDGRLIRMEDVGK